MRTNQYKSRTKKFCQTTKMHLNNTQVVHVELIKESIVENLKRDFPELDPSGLVSEVALNRYNTKRIKPTIANATGLDLQGLESISYESEVSYTMMSQNRQEIKDRELADNDYDITIKAELEVRELQGKLDFVIAQLAEMKPNLRSN